MVPLWVAWQRDDTASFFLLFLSAFCRSPLWVRFVLSFVLGVKYLSQTFPIDGQSQKANLTTTSATVSLQVGKNIYLDGQKQKGDRSRETDQNQDAKRQDTTKGKVTPSKG
jgi:hypothetical protein